MVSLISNKSQTQNLRLILRLVLVIVGVPTIWYFFDEPWRWLEEYKWSENCNVFRGKWVPFPAGPLYRNSTCPEIFDQQNCMKYGRLDTEFLKWRWKPNQCELPVFDAWQFLELVRGKSIAFVGDSVGRNQMQSLMCLLATAANPSNSTHMKDSKSRHWHYQDYNFTIASFWSPYLVRAKDISRGNTTYNRLVNLYLDEPDPDWASKIEAFDYVIISAARWFFGPQMYSLKNKTIGCFWCQSNDTSNNLSMYYGYREAFKTSFETLIRLENFKGLTFLRALSPAHFENGEWDKGGSCPRTKPVSEGSVRLSEPEMEMYTIQKDAIINAQRRGRNRGLEFQLIDATSAMLVRPDGHPNYYGHWPSEKKTIADCVHWCLPGPIDTWNEFLFHMLKILMKKKR
ncbi:unnamed protein product [Rhodiola kirilowii]